MFGVHLSTRECGAYVVVALCGELDIADAPAVATALAAAAAGEPKIIVDLEHLAFIDCSGLNALLCARKQAMLAGGDLLLAALQQHMHRLLTITGLSSVFSVHASVEEAVSSAEHARPVVATVP